MPTPGPITFVDDDAAATCGIELSVDEGDSAAKVRPIMLTDDDKPVEASTGVRVLSKGVSKLLSFLSEEQGSDAHGVGKATGKATGPPDEQYYATLRKIAQHGDAELRAVLVTYTYEVGAESGIFLREGELVGVGSEPGTFSVKYPPMEEVTKPMENKHSWLDHLRFEHAKAKVIDSKTSERDDAVPAMRIRAKCNTFEREVLVARARRERDRSALKIARAEARAEAESDVPAMEQQMVLALAAHFAARRGCLVLDGARDKVVPLSFRSATRTISREHYDSIVKNKTKEQVSMLRDKAFDTIHEAAEKASERVSSSRHKLEENFHELADGPMERVSEFAGSHGPTQKVTEFADSHGPTRNMRKPSRHLEDDVASALVDASKEEDDDDGTRVPEQIAIEDAWVTMLHYAGATPRASDERFWQTFAYAPGDVVEVRDDNLNWLPGIVAFSPTYEEGAQIGLERTSYDMSSDDFVQLQIRAIFEFLKTDDADAKERAVHPLEERLVELNLSASEAREHEEEFVNVIRPSGNVELGRSSLDVRVPYAATRVLWGEAPFLWQQWALLKAERHMRFEAHHPDDFAEVNWEEWARAHFFEWLNDGRVDQDAAPNPNDANVKFWRYWKSFDRHPGAQAALLEHMLEPFALIDTVNSWDFDDSEVTCYTYISMQGCGWASALAILTVQIAVPLILRESVLKDLLECFWDIGGPWNWPNKDQDSFSECRHAGRKEHEEQGTTAPTQAMFVCIVIIYLTQVVPDQWLRFELLLGGKRTTRSWLTSLRQSVWDKNEDTDLQKLGYMIELNMNTLYVVGLYTLNILMIIAYDNPVDILLNALAIEFVHQLDEAVVTSGGFDPGWRHMRAGTVEMVLRRYIDLHLLDRIMQEPRYTRMERAGVSEGVSCASPRNLEKSRSPSKRILKPFQDASSPQFQGKGDSDQMTPDYYEALATLAKRRTEHRWYPAYGMLSRFSHRLGLPTNYMFRKHWIRYLSPQAGETTIDWDKVLYQHPSDHYEHVMKKEMVSSLFDDEPTTHESIDYDEKAHGQLRTHLKMRRRYRMFMDSKSRFARLARVVVFVGFDSIMKILAYTSQYAFPMFLIGCLLFAV